MIFVLGLTVSGRCHQHLWIVIIHPIWGVGESVQCSVQWENVQIAIDFSDHPNSEHDEHADPKHPHSMAHMQMLTSEKPVLLRCAGETPGLNFLDA